MDVSKVVNTVIEKVKDEPAVEGIFLFGSFASKKQDEFSDIDIGIATRDTVKDYRKAYGMSADIFAAIGHSIGLLDEEQEHTHMVSALYGKSEFPPAGLKVDLLFGQLKHLAEKIPSEPENILLDRSGGLAAWLEKRATTHAHDDIADCLRHSMNAFPFFVFDVARAFSRKDRARAQSTADQMRKAIFRVAAVRAGHGANGGPYGLMDLKPGEKWIVEQTYQVCTRRTVQKLTELYMACLVDIQGAYGIEAEVSAIQQSLTDII
jgi:predicted nucleotidyltransferase